jgi:putative lipoic acid-binding regulatory protein
VDEKPKSLIEFPTDFPLKIIGKTQDGFAQAVAAVVVRHDPSFAVASIEMRASKHAKYLSLTCTVKATSQAQLDALYQDLCDHPMVIRVF